MAKKFLSANETEDGHLELVIKLSTNITSIIRDSAKKRIFCWQVNVTCFVEVGEKGWVSHKKDRKDGIRSDLEYISPQGLKFKSKVAALRHMAETTATATSDISSLFTFSEPFMLYPKATSDLGLREAQEAHDVDEANDEVLPGDEFLERSQAGLSGFRHISVENKPRRDTKFRVAGIPGYGLTFSTPLQAARGRRDYLAHLESLTETQMENTTSGMCAMDCRRLQECLKRYREYHKGVTNQLKLTPRLKVTRPKNVSTPNGKRGTSQQNADVVLAPVQDDLNSLKPSKKKKGAKKSTPDLELEKTEAAPQKQQEKEKGRKRSRSKQDAAAAAPPPTPERVTKKARFSYPTCPKPTKASLTAMKMLQLKAELKRRGADIKGIKQVVVTRLFKMMSVEWDTNDEAAAEATEELIEEPTEVLFEEPNEEQRIEKQLIEVHIKELTEEPIEQQATALIKEPIREEPTIQEPTEASIEETPSYFRICVMNLLNHNRVHDQAIKEPIREEPIRGQPIEEPIREEPIEEDPIEEESIQEDPIQEELIQEELVQEDLIQEDPIQKDPIQEDPIQEDLIQEELIQEELIQEELIQEDPIQEDPIQEEPIQKDPIQEDPIQEDPIQEELIQEELVQEDVIQEELVQEDVIQEDPIQEDPIQEDPIQEDLIQEDPIQEDPIQEDPIQEEPIQEPIEEHAVSKSIVQEEEEVAEYVSAASANDALLDDLKRLNEMMIMKDEQIARLQQQVKAQVDQDSQGKEGEITPMTATTTILRRSADFVTQVDLLSSDLDFDVCSQCVIGQGVDCEGCTLIGN